MLAGSRLGPYRIVAPLGGAGAAEAAWRAEDPEHGRDVAIRLLPLDRVADERTRERLGSDLRVTARLSHRNLVPVVALIEDGPRSLVTELPEGESLIDRLRGRGSLPLEDALDVAAQVATGLHHAHVHGVVHGSLTAADVHLAADGTATIGTLGAAGVGAALAGGSAWVPSASVPAPLPHDDVRAVGELLELMLTGHVGERPDALRDSLRAAMVAAYGSTDSGTADAAAEAIARARADTGGTPYPDAAAFARELTALRLMLPRLTAPPPGRPRRTLRTAAQPQASARRAHPLADAGPWLIIIAVCLSAVAISIAMLPDPPTRQSPAALQATTPTTVVQPLVPIDIASDPPGAAIRIDGVDLGRRTPARIEIVAGATPQVELSLEGFVTAAIIVDRADVERGSISLPLSPDQPVARRPTEVTLVGDYPFEVLDERNAMLSPAAKRHQLTTALPRLRLEAASVFLRRTIAVPDGGGTISAPRATFVSIRSSAELARCRIFLNGIPTDRYPGEGQFRVAQGTHQVSLKCTDGRRVEPQRIDATSAGTIVKFPPS